MKRKSIEQNGSKVIAPIAIGLGILVSAVAALAVLFFIGSRRRVDQPSQPPNEDVMGHQDGHGAASVDEATIMIEQVPVQPAVDTFTSSEVPHHFTEDIVVPGFTETGTDVLQEDDAIGRSPEGT